MRLVYASSFKMLADFFEMFEEEYKAETESLLKDFVEARGQLASDIAGADFEYRACIVVAERYTTQLQRATAMIDYGLIQGEFKAIDGVIYEVVDCLYTSVHWESNQSADSPDVDTPEGCILWDTGSYHERWTYVLRPISPSRAGEILK